MTFGRVPGIIACLEDPLVMGKILEHLDEMASPEPLNLLLLARASPAGVFGWGSPRSPPPMLSPTGHGRGPAGKWRCGLHETRFHGLHKGAWPFVRCSAVNKPLDRADDGVYVSYTHLTKRPQNGNGRGDFSGFLSELRQDFGLKPMNIRFSWCLVTSDLALTSR